MNSADLCQWDEEIYFSLLMAAVNAERIDEPEETVLGLYERAIPVRPARAEARHGASRYCRSRNRFPEGFRHAEAGMALPLPSEGISLNPWVYEYGMLEEYSINAYHFGQYNICLHTCLQILNKSKIPSDVLTRSSTLARRALAKMIDPVWGCQQSAYSYAFAPAWQF